MFFTDIFSIINNNYYYIIKYSELSYIPWCCFPLSYLHLLVNIQLNSSFTASYVTYFEELISNLRLIICLQNSPFCLKFNWKVKIKSTIMLLKTSNYWAGFLSLQKDWIGTQDIPYILQTFSLCDCWYYSSCFQAFE